MGDSFVKFHGIGYERKVAVEVAASSDPAPECLCAQGVLSLSGIQPKELPGRGIEVGQNAVTIQE